jgi:hypothetical protein
MALLVSVWVHGVGAGKGRGQTEPFSQQGFTLVIKIAMMQKLHTFACITATFLATYC